MVMEASPSPQCVGREFVRQYYTLLNRAPAHLHRFYNNNSLFIHGGLECKRDSNPAIGQKEIHQKIQALNFRDCHAKINQVDSQSTLGNGVVVQVSGELSNNGQPMRRFTQTFVLAAQAPKKYYVHNDIFRYQDFGYADDDQDAEGVNTICEQRLDIENERQDEEEEAVHVQLNNKIQNTESHSQASQQLTSIAQQQVYYSLQQQSVHQMVQQVTINGTVHEDSSIISMQPAASSLQTQQQFDREPVSQELLSCNSDEDPYVNRQEQMQPQKQLHVKSEDQGDINYSDAQIQLDNISLSIGESETDTEILSQNLSNNPKTYANLVKSFPSSCGVTSPQPPVNNLRNEDRLSSQTGQVPIPPNVVTNPVIHRIGSTQHSQYQKVPRISGPVPRDLERRGGGRVGQYTDAHQLFLGNLPHNASESDLKQIFERYGRVADLRVHSKQNDRMKGAQGSNNSRVPNYGFITFEDQSVVSKVLSNLPIYFPDENGQKLNVEEKKIRPRELGAGSGRSSNIDSAIRTMTLQQQRTSVSSSNILRGNQHGSRGRGGFPRGAGENSRGSMRQSGISQNNQNFQNRR